MTAEQSQILHLRRTDPSAVADMKARFQSIISEGEKLLTEVSANFEIASRPDGIERFLSTEPLADGEWDSTGQKQSVMPALAALDKHNRDLMPRVNRWRRRAENAISDEFVPPNLAINQFREVSIGRSQPFAAAKQDLDHLTGEVDRLKDWYDHAKVYVQPALTNELPGQMKVRVGLITKITEHHWLTLFTLIILILTAILAWKALG